MRRRDQLLAGWGVDPVVAGETGRRTGQAHMHLAGPRGTDHLDDFSGCRPAHQGIINHDHPLAFDNLADRVQLELDAEVPDRLLGLDEGSSHVVIADQAQLEGYPGFLSIAHRRRDAGIRHGNHHVGIDMVLPCQLPAKLLANLVYLLTENGAVRTGKIDEFKNTG